MKIIKEGKIPENEVYRANCIYCHTEVVDNDYVLNGPFEP